MLHCPVACFSIYHPLGGILMPTSAAEPAGALPTAAHPRYPFLDLLRGATLLSMVAYHAVWDLVFVFGANWPWFWGTPGFLWQQSICWVFILLSGFCWPLGHHPLRHGLLVLGAGVLVSVSTLLFMPQSRVLFGILTFLGAATLLLIPLEPLLRKIHPYAGLAGAFMLFMLLRNVNDGILGTSLLPLLQLPQALYHGYVASFLGFTDPDFFSTDYFSLLPWFFLFLCGYFGNRIIWRHGLQKHLTCRVPWLGFLGRHSLLLYLLHQPVLYACFLLADTLL